MVGFLPSLILAALAASASPLDAALQTKLDAELRCHLGVYAFGDGEKLTITGENGQPRDLSYTFSNGQFGTLSEDGKGNFSDGTVNIRFAPCAANALDLARSGQDARHGAKLQLVEKQVSFSSDGITMNGKLVLPPGGRADSLAVWIEGSNNDPSTDDTVWQYELSRRGVAVFVYDKRGTGGSGGTLSSDFEVRARDTVAAVKVAKGLVPGLKRYGVIGGSQGGWVAPLVAQKIRLDFVIPAFAMAEGPIAQDRELVALQLRQAGFGDAELALARKLTAITERIVRSDMRDGFADLEAFKAQQGDAAWLKAIAPRSYTGLFLLFSTADIKANGPALAQGLRFDFEPLPIIAAVRARQLWLLAGSDSQAPNAVTQTLLRDLQSKRANIAVVVFPRAEHGLIETIDTVDGPKKRYPPQLFDITAKWIKSKSLPAPGNFILMPSQ